MKTFSPKISKWLKRSAITLMCGGLFLMGGLFSLSKYAKPLQRQDIEKPLYTVGDENYSKALDAGKNVVKFGRTIGGIYPGGLAFQTPEAAHQHLQSIGKEEVWGVYVLSGDYDRDSKTFSGQRHTTVSLMVIDRIVQDGQSAASSLRR